MIRTFLHDHRRRVSAARWTFLLFGVAFLLGVPNTSVAPSEPEEQTAWLNVVGTVPLEGEALGRQIVIFFDDQISVREEEAGREVFPFTLTPEVNGSFRVGSNFVAFTSEAFPEDRIIRVALSDTLRSVAGKALNPRQRTFSFPTFVFEPRRIWLLDENLDQPVLGVLFPISVSPDDVKRHVEVQTKSGRDVAFAVARGSDTNISRLELKHTVEWPVMVIFKAGLPDRTGTLRLMEDKSFTFRKEPALKVTRARWARFDAGGQQIRLDFSAPVYAAALKRHLTLTDAETEERIPFALVDEERHSQRHHIKVALKKSRSIDLAISQGLVGGRNVVLEQPYSERLTYEPEPLGFRRARFNSRNKEGHVLNFRLNYPVEGQPLREHLEFSPQVQDLRVEPDSYGGFNVFGSWSSKQHYTVTLTSGLIYGDGFTLKEPLTHSVLTGSLPRFLGFGYEEKYYFPRRADGALTIVSRNIDSAKITAHRLFPANIAVAMKDLRNGAGGSAFSRNWCEELAHIEVPVAKNHDQLVETALDTESLFPSDRKGVFCLEAQGTPHGYGSKIALLTDIGVLAHWQNEELVVFVHDLFSLAPLRSAAVSVYSSKNQMLGRARTDRRGIVQFRRFEPSLGTPKVVVVERGDDYAFLELNVRRDDPREYSPVMEAYDRDGYDAFIYADRELYRPGDTVNLRWIVRSGYGPAAADVALLLEVVKPNGRNLLSKPVVLSALGTGGLSLQTQKVYPTGSYKARLLLPGTKKEVGKYSFSLEEFVPNRIKASAKVAEPYWQAGEEYRFEVNAEHLFGGPAADRRAEAKVILRRGAFASEQWSGYRFGNDSKYKPETISCGEQRTDSTGKALFVFRYRAPAEATFPLKATVVGRVFELGGRAVAGRAETTVFPSDTSLGIAASPVSGGKDIEVLAAAIQSDETPADLDSVKVTLERQVWSYYVRRFYGHHAANWSESFEPLESRDVKLTEGTGSTRFSVGDYGYYRVRVHSDRTPQYSTLSFYAYRGRCELMDVTRPSLIKLTLDKEEYEVGDEVALRIESPFDGKAFVVLQGETIQEAFTVDLEDNAGVARFNVGVDQVPNIWAEVTVLHPARREQAQVYPFASFAMANVKVCNSRRGLVVDLSEVPETVRPQTKVPITVAVSDSRGRPVRAELTLAAVDEGIHLITGYRNPNPYVWLNRSRRPDFRRAHYYDRVAYDFDKPSEGGGVGAELAERVSTVGENWIRSVALWSGVVQTNRQGKATISLQIPEYTGQLRLVAVACSADALGSASTGLRVRRNYSLRTSMPRFLLPGDRTRCRAVVFNHTDRPCSAHVSWSPSGTIRGGGGSEELQIPAMGEAALCADFEAGRRMGQGEIRWDVVVSDSSGTELERFTELAPLPVRPPAAYQSAHELIVLKPGDTRTIRNTTFIDDDRAEVGITVGANPLLRLKEALSYVVGYPYGCTEQTTSKLMPLYLLRKNADLLDTTLEDDQPIDAYVESGIARLFAMQTASGGLGFWPGASTPYPYGSVYAFHFLTLVENGREFELPAANMKALREYVRNIAMDWSDTSRSARYLRAYAVFTLALGGDLEAIRQIERFDNLVMPRTSRFLLAAALARATQDEDRVKLYLSSAPCEPYTVTEQDRTLNSDIRNTAVELLALNQMNADAATLEQKAKLLVDFLAYRGHGSTQETAFAVTALADYLEKSSGNIDLAAAVIEGPERTASVSGRQTYSAKHKGQGGAFTVANTGEVDLFVNVTTRGVPETIDLRPVSEGVTVERTFFTNRGDSIVASESALRQGETYVVGISMDCRQTVKNLVVADLLSGGIEIENPRLGADVMPRARFRGAVAPSHLEIRDDRLVLAFDELRKGTHLFYYVVRAVTPGSYQYPAVEAECMYDARVRGRSTPSVIEVGDQEK